ncbi:hypothetical protein [Devosia sp. Naph2]|uniref:hypothetical protein n=1 Tax=Devosia polycyclovorans TaxID=3345148 RepID=UPI0035D0EA67
MPTYYGVQGYRKGQRGALLEDQPVVVKDEAAALRKAEVLAKSRCGVVAFVREVDAFDDYSEPRFLAVHGEVPEHIADAAYIPY